jgi:hypothetical protein
MYNVPTGLAHDAPVDHIRSPRCTPHTLTALTGLSCLKQQSPGPSLALPRYSTAPPPSAAPSHSSTTWAVTLVEVITLVVTHLQLQPPGRRSLVHPPAPAVLHQVVLLVLQAHLYLARLAAKEGQVSRPTLLQPCHPCLKDLRGPQLLLSQISKAPKRVRGHLLMKILRRVSRAPTFTVCRAPLRPVPPFCQRHPPHDGLSEPPQQQRCPVMALYQGLQLILTLHSG